MFVKPDANVSVLRNKMADTRKRREYHTDFWLVACDNNQSVNINNTNVKIARRDILISFFSGWN